MSEDCKNCYKLAKKIQAKEQECEELKEKLERQKDYIVSYKSYIYEKEKQLKKQLQSKEQECEELKQWEKDAENLFKTQTDNADKIINRYKQALDEIEKIINKKRYIISVVRAPLKPIIMRINKDFLSILDIINKVKEQR